MQREIITIPRDLMRLMNVNWNFDTRGQDAGETTNGINQTIHSAFPRWVGSPAIHMRRDTLRRWIAIAAAADGRRGMYRVPMVDPLGFDWIAAAGAHASTGVALDDGSLFDDGGATDFEPFALAVSDYPAGSKEISVDMASAPGLGLQVSQIMSHSDWPFRVLSIWHEGGTQYRLRIKRPLKVAMTEGDHVLLEGVGLFEEAESFAAGLSYDRNHTARPTFSLREVLTR